MKITLSNVRDYLKDNVAISDDVHITLGKKQFVASPSGLTFNEQGQAMLKFLAVAEPKAMQANGQRKASKGVAK